MQKLEGSDINDVMDCGLGHDLFAGLDGNDFLRDDGLPG